MEGTRARCKAARRRPAEPRAASRDRPAPNETRRRVKSSTHGKFANAETRPAHVSSPGLEPIRFRWNQKRTLSRCFTVRLIGKPLRASGSSPKACFSGRTLARAPVRSKMNAPSRSPQERPPEPVVKEFRNANFSPSGIMAKTPLCPERRLAGPLTCFKRPSTEDCAGNNMARRCVFQPVAGNRISGKFGASGGNARHREAALPPSSAEPTSDRRFTAISGGSAEGPESGRTDITKYLTPLRPLGVETRNSQIR